MPFSAFHMLIFDSQLSLHIIDAIISMTLFSHAFRRRRHFFTPYFFIAADTLIFILRRYHFTLYLVIYFRFIALIRHYWYLVAEITLI